MNSIELLGAACLRADGEALSGPPTQRHRIALLALVVDAWPQPLPRDRALALLWPERDDPSGRRLLNLAVHVLRSALGEQAIASLGDGLLFDPATASCDLHALKLASASGQHAEVVRLCTGPLLDGFHLPESAEFDEWLNAARHRVERLFTNALRTQAADQQRDHDLAGAVESCRRLAEHEPHESEHALRLMRALDAAGRRTEAIGYAAVYAERVRQDLDLEPDPAVAALARELRTAPPRPPSLPSVAVLPFLNIGGNPEQDYFVDGMTEDVIAHLSKLRSVTVISRSSVMRFKHREHSLQEIGRLLGTGTVLDGSVRSSGNRVRIVATLVDVETDRQLWAETYDREVTDIFAIQTDVALRIAAALKAELSAEERKRIRSEATHDLQAYRHFLHGRQLFVTYATTDLRQAVTQFERATALDPGFAQAHAMLAMCWIELAEQGLTEPRAAYLHAESAVSTALVLDPEAGDAHATAAYLKAVHDFDWDGAELGMLRARELSPGSAYVCDLMGRMYWAVERYDEALPLVLMAQELDPLAHRNDLTTMLLRAGRYAEALGMARRAADVHPAGAREHATLGWALFFTGDAEAGVTELERAVEHSNRDTLWLGQLGEALALMGEAGRAREILKELETRSAGAFVSPYHFAYIYAGLGEADRALDLLEQAVNQRTGPTYSIKGSFLFRPLRTHPRFRALMQSMNLDRET